MNKNNLDIAYFLSFCIEQYKEAKHLSGAEAAKIFDKFGVLEYLERHFEPLHSQSRQWILEDIDEFIGLRKGEVYASETYHHLETEETKLWHLGPVALYEELK